MKVAHYNKDANQILLSDQKWAENQRYYSKGPSRCWLKNRFGWRRQQNNDFVSGTKLGNKDFLEDNLELHGGGLSCVCG